MVARLREIHASWDSHLLSVFRGWRSPNLRFGLSHPGPWAGITLPKGQSYLCCHHNYLLSLGRTRFKSARLHQPPRANGGTSERYKRGHVRLCSIPARGVPPPWRRSRLRRDCIGRPARTPGRHRGVRQGAEQTAPNYKNRIIHTFCWQPGTDRQIMGSWRSGLTRRRCRAEIRHADP